MAGKDIQELLNEHLKDAEAMEQSVKRMLDAMIDTTEDPEVRG